METYTGTFSKTGWALVLAWIGVIMISSLVPASAMHQLDVSIARVDLVLHTFSYAVLAFLLVHALDASGVGTVQAGLSTIVGVLVFGALLEIAQPMVGRATELADWLADGVGAVVGLVGSAIWRSLAARSA